MNTHSLPKRVSKPNTGNLYNSNSCSKTKYKSFIPVSNQPLISDKQEVTGKYQTSHLLTSSLLSNINCVVRENHKRIKYICRRSMHNTHYNFRAKKSKNSHSQMKNIINKSRQKFRICNKCTPKPTRQLHSRLRSEAFQLKRVTVRTMMIIDKISIKATGKCLLDHLSELDISSINKLHSKNVENTFTNIDNDMERIIGKSNSPIVPLTTKLNELQIKNCIDQNKINKNLQEIYAQLCSSTHILEMNFNTQFKQN